MTRQVSKPNIFWAPSLETARKIDDEDTVKSIETARYRFAASLADLKRCYDEQAGRLRAAFVAEVAALTRAARRLASACRVGYFEPWSCRFRPRQLPALTRVCGQFGASLPFTIAFASATVDVRAVNCRRSRLFRFKVFVI